MCPCKITRLRVTPAAADICRPDQVITIAACFFRCKLHGFYKSICQDSAAEGSSHYGVLHMPDCIILGIRL